MPKATVVVFPGSNCNEEALLMLQNIGFDASYTWYADSFPQNLDFCFLPGGFSYGDRLRSGAIASFSKIIENIKLFAERGGYVMGVCNGFQILTEAKILEGALIRNASGSFVCKTVELQTQSHSSIFTESVPSVMKMQIAHADGRYFCTDDTLKKLQDSHQVAFTYSENINGSKEDIAGIFGGKYNNILGMMPHPERDLVANTNGIEIFRSIIKNIK